ncbi:MAG: LD-carboxypeptidase [Capsulimonadales bacterium]|nr:LD-carboxypeptidase [Capsulimonadales bacterium]
MSPASPVWPRPLKPGGVIGLCSPSSPSPDGAIAAAAAVLETRGFRVVVAPNATRRDASLPYLAGPDPERLSDLNLLLRDPSVDLILCARGGYGAGRLLDGIDYDALRSDPKPLVGYSDITALSLGIAARTGIVSFSGVMATGNEGIGSALCDPFSAESFLRAVTATDFPRRSDSPPDTVPWRILRGPTRVSGPLYPVCLSLLISLLGTPYVPDLSGAILLIEDVHEELYRVDRFLTQLRLSGTLDRIAALLIGSFNGMNEAQNAELAERIPELVLSMTGDRVAVAAGVAYGHIPRRLTLPVGGFAEVDLETGVFFFDRTNIPG